MAVISTQGNQKQKLANLVGNIIARNHRLEYLIYLKTMKLLINLDGREQSPYLPLPKIRHSLSSMKIDRPMANHLLRQLCECGFLSYIPGHGYKLNSDIIQLQSIPYRPEDTRSPCSK